MYVYELQNWRNGDPANRRVYIQCTESEHGSWCVELCDLSDSRSFIRFSDSLEHAARMSLAAAIDVVGDK